MSTTATLEGQITLHLTPRGADGCAVRLTSSRVTRVSAILVRRTPAEAAHLVPLLFSLCGEAQKAACQAALEAAMGIDPTPAERLARELRVLTEILDSHVWNTVVVWPKLVQLSPRMDVLAALRQTTLAIRQGAAGTAGSQAGPPALRAGLHQTGTLLRVAVFGPGGLPAMAEDLAAWAARAGTPAARLVQEVLRRVPAGFGAGGVPLLPDLGADWYGLRLARQINFTHTPTLEGSPAEVGALAAMGDHPLVAGVVAQHGPGLLARLVALLAQLADLPARILAAADTVAPRRGGAGPDPHSGCGVADTARGRLAHWVRLENGRVAGYRTVAPTEWNFHPDGPAVRALRGQPADPGLQRRSDLLVAALDPCIPCRVVIADGEPAHA